MRCITGGGPVKVSTLAQLDALVASHVTGVAPETCWEDSNALFRFESESEARAAIQDAYYQMFSPETDWEHTAVTRKETYPCYSSNLEEAWRIVECLSDAGQVLQMRRDGADWVASFGKIGTAAAATVPLALCLAALLTRGVEAVLALEPES